VNARRKGMNVEPASKLAVVENLLIAVRLSNRSAVEVVEAEAKVDLAEFELTQEEVDKFRTIIKKLNDSLAESLKKRCSAVSIVSELRATERY
jgi:hypothetical protein